MHLVKCPHCRKQFQFSEPVVKSSMECPYCGRTFVGSSAEPPRESIPAGPKSPRRTYSKAELIKLGCCVLGILAIVAMVIGIYHGRTHRTVVVRDARTGRVLERKRMKVTEIERKVAQARGIAAEAGRPGQVESPVGQPPVPASFVRAQTAISAAPAPVRAIQDDPKLRTDWSLVSRDAAAGGVYVCGRVRSRYAVALKDVTVAVSVGGASGPSRTYRFVPAGGRIRFSIFLGNVRIDRDAIDVTATGRQVDEDTIVWGIDPVRIERAVEDEKVVWTGRTRNLSSSPIKDVVIYCDFFDSDGIGGGNAVGGLIGAQTMGAGGSAAFEVAFDAPAAEIYRTIVARAVGRKVLR